VGDTVFHSVHTSGVILKHFYAQRRPRECPKEEATGCLTIANKSAANKQNFVNEVRLHILFTIPDFPRFHF